MCDTNKMQPMARRSFQFTVNGSERAGVLYVTLSFDDVDRAIVRATKLAAKRSGDAAPVLVHSMPPRR